MLTKHWFLWSFLFFADLTSIYANIIDTENLENNSFFAIVANKDWNHAFEKIDFAIDAFPKTFGMPTTVSRTDTILENDDLKNTIEDHESDDTLVLSIFGHGGAGYLIDIDGGLAYDELFLALEKFRGEKGPVKRLILILFSCYSGSVATAVKNYMKKGSPWFETAFVIPMSSGVKVTDVDAFQIFVQKMAEAVFVKKTLRQLEAEHKALYSQRVKKKGITNREVGDYLVVGKNAKNLRETSLFEQAPIEVGKINQEKGSQQFIPLRIDLQLPKPSTILDARNTFDEYYDLLKSESNTDNPLNTIFNISASARFSEKEYRKDSAGFYFEVASVSLANQIAKTARTFKNKDAKIIVNYHAGYKHHTEKITYRFRANADEPYQTVTTSMLQMANKCIRHSFDALYDCGD